MFQCGVKLITDHSRLAVTFGRKKTECEEGVTFGCNDNTTLFVEDGCNATFSLTRRGISPCEVHCAAAPGQRSICGCNRRWPIQAQYKELEQQFVSTEEETTGKALGTYVVTFESVELLSRKRRGASLTARPVGRVYAGQLLVVIRIAETVTLEDDGLVHWTLGRIKSPGAWLPLRRVAETNVTMSQRNDKRFKEAAEAIYAMNKSKAEEDKLLDRLKNLITQQRADVTNYAVPMRRSLRVGQWPQEGISHVMMRFKPLESLIVPGYIVTEMGKSKGIQATYDDWDQGATSDGEDPTQQLQFDDF